MFNESMIANLEWQQRVPLQTKNGHYRIEITWALDRYRVLVYRKVQEPEKLIRVHHPFYPHTAVATANRLLRLFENRE